MPVQFQNYDLGNVLQTAETIKGMRRQAENDKIRNAYMGQQIQTMQSADQARTAETQAKAAEVNAKRAYHVADAVVRSENPLEAVQNLAPDFVQEFEQNNGPGSFARLQPDQVKQIFSPVRERAMVEAGIQPKYTAPLAGQQDGKDVYFQTDEQGNPRVLPGITPRPQKSGGIKVRGADGTEITIGGDGQPDYSSTEIGKATRTNLEQAFVNSQGNAYALREQLSKYRDEFSTMGGRLKAGIASMKDIAGMQLAPQQQQYLNDFSSWKADTNRLLSTYLNQLSGAAISPAEEARLKAGFPNADDGPTVYKAKAESTLKAFALAQARAAYLLSAPGVKLDSVSLESMSGIIAQQANALAKSLESGGMSAEAAKQKAIADTRARFGLGQ